MKSFIVLLSLPFLACHNGMGGTETPQDEYPEIEAVVSEFIAGGDEQSVSRLEQVLHPTFRVLINQFMGGPDVTILDRDTYLNMINSGDIGGDPRTSEVLSTEVVGNLAFMRAKVRNSQIQFNTLYTLVLDPGGKWWLASEAPFVSPIAG
ncbi:MAG: nuclear transport factor 2 family protein [Bacteroidota bacterium]